MWPTGEQLSLIKSFLVWKTALFAVAALSPGPGYDTSTSLLFDSHSARPSTAYFDTSFLPAARPLLLRLVRWDAIYFTSIAKNGYEYEQEWAFGWGFSRLVGATTAALSTARSIEAHAFSAVLISALSHLCSVLLLHALCRELFRGAANGGRLSISAAFLHIFAPAGLFLCSPNGESTFSALNFAGFLLHAYGLKSRSLFADSCVVLSGLAFGTASTVRSNGILAGVIFAVDLAMTLWSAMRAGLDFPKLRYCAALVAGGLLVGAGYALPQGIAFWQYCVDEAAGPRPPWCTALPPSVFAYVQDHYWGVGFLRYWTLSNAPLFLLATPMLCLMCVSGISVLKRQLQPPAKPARARATDGSALAWRLALPQLILTLLTFTNFHVQIITRLASGYVLPYIWIVEAFNEKQEVRVLGRSIALSKAVTQWMVMYALIQGGLYANFLPPA